MASPATSEKIKPKTIGKARAYLKNLRTFIREAKKPSTNEYCALLKGHLGALFMIGLFAYVIKVVNIPIVNFFLGGKKE